jgi:hypothetical protein
MVGKIVKVPTTEQKIIIAGSFGTIKETYYRGMTFDGEWLTCRNPIVLANSLKEYIQNNIDEFLPLAEPKEI